MPAKTASAPCTARYDLTPRSPIVSPPETTVTLAPVDAFADVAALDEACVDEEPDAGLAALEATGARVAPPPPPPGENAVASAMAATTVSATSATTTATTRPVAFTGRAR